MKKRVKKNSTSGEKILLKNVLIGSAVGTVLFFITTTLSALIILKNDLSEDTYPAFLIVAGAVSAFFGGFVSVIPTKRNGLILGALSVLPTYFIIFAVSSIFNRTGISVYGWIMLGVMVLFGGLAGIVAANKKRKIK